MTKITHTSRTFSAVLMVGASSLALATPAQANDYLFTSADKPLETGQRMTQTEALTQISLTGGGTASFTDKAEYQINADGSVELYRGTVTVAGTPDRPVVVRMPKGLEGRVSGRGSSANFSVQPNGDAAGHALTGVTEVGRDGRFKKYSAGAMWSADVGARPTRVIANAAQATPNAEPAEPQVVAISADAGPVAAAVNGIPVTLGDALAAAGASSDILSAARRVEASVGNPLLDTFPSGDLALLVTRAAQIEGAFGGSPFPQAQADIIRTYLRFLAGNGGASAGAQFLSTFSAFSLDYLDLIRVGGVPSGFANAGLADINAYLSFINRTGALTQLGAQDQVLANAYLAFLRDGGNPDLFAASFTDLTDAFFAFVRAGNDPDAFAGANAAVLAQTIAFLSDSGLTAQLSAADQALVAAFLQNGGLAFTGQFQTALDEYFTFLAQGRLPSAYEPVDQASLRQFLETLSDTGLLSAVLGDQAQFYADYLAFLRGGGDVDAFAGLPVNIFTDYAAQLNAYRAFLDAGNRPSDFTTAGPAQLQAFIAELQAAGALDRFVGADAAFFAAFAAFVENGGAFDAFGGLNANIFAGYATELQAYFAFLEQGGVPSTYGPLSQEVIAQYLAELQAADAKGRFLPDLADFYTAYFAFIQGGGNPDTFAGLPIPPDFGAFAAALNAYADFLAGGGFPADFADADLSVLASFIEALGTAGELDARLGANADLLNAYFAFLAGGGAPNAFAGLPIYADYVSALNQYFAFLNAGGLPADYADLDQATLNAFLAALTDLDGGLGGFGDLNAFFADYAAFVLGGGDPAAFAGLPVYAQYVTDLNAYFAFLANGGLPDEYAVLSQDILTAYLAALAGTQGGLTGFGDLDAFFADYAAFVLGGGDPTTFAGLPVFAQYIADLNAYFAFLANGGLPSEYTVLSQDILNAYLDLLANAQGGLSGFAGLNTFFVDFFAFIQGGGNVDQFPGLPDGIGNDFPNFFAAQFGDNPRARGADRVLVEDDGQITRIEYPNSAPLVFGENDQTLRERGRVGDIVAWTRYENGAGTGGVTNSNDHLIVGAPAINLPASGTVEYALIGGTIPTDFFAPEGETGFFGGRLAVAFGSTNRVGIEFDVLSEASEGVRGWRVETAGGADDPASSGLFVAPDSSFQSNNQTISISGIEGLACSRFCSASVSGSLFGDGASHAGFAYQINDEATSNRVVIQGSAVFGAGAGAIDGLGTRPDTTPPVPTGTGTPLILASASEFAATTGVKYNISTPSIALSGFDLPTFTLAANGALTAAEDGVSVRGIGTTTATDISGNGRFLIGRWTDGEYESSQSAEDGALTSAQGFHYLLAGPTTGAFELSTMGSIEYELIAATAPTIADGSLAPGQFEADMIVLLGTAPTVAMEGSITHPTSGDDYVYSFASTGGIANPDQSDSEFRVRFGRNVNFAFTADQITTSDNSCNDTCVIQFAGYFAGDDALELGVTYTAQTGTFGRQISGAAIFGNGVFDDGSASGGGTGGGSATIENTAIFNASPLFITSGSGATTQVEATGQITGFQNSRGFGITLGDSVGITPSKPGTLKEAGRVGDIMAWTSYRDPTDAQGPNHTSHYIAGAQSFTIPTSGVVTYSLIGGTAPTDASLADGTSGFFTGQMAVTFGSTPQLGLEFEVFSQGDGYRIETAGGVADPANGGLAISGFGRFSGSFDVTGIAGDACTGTGNCIASVTGNMFADGYSHAGVAYAVRDGDVNLRGTAAFAAGATGIAGVGDMAARTSSIQAKDTASIAPSVVPATMTATTTGGQWARWGGSASASAQGVNASQTLTLLPPGATPIEEQIFAPEASREAAIRQAEAVMGGAISFARPAGAVRPQ